MRIDNRDDIINDGNSNVLNYGNKEFTICLNIRDNTIKLLSHENEMDGMPIQIYSGHLIGRLIMYCDCNEYECFFAIKINLKDPLLEEISLTSETIEINDDKGNCCRIKNTFSTGQTDCHMNYDKFITLPIMPFDFKNPIKTIDKIKGLIIFS